MINFIIQAPAQIATPKVTKKKVLSFTGEVISQSSHSIFRLVLRNFFRVKHLACFATASATTIKKV